jgi:protein ImuB
MSNGSSTLFAAIYAAEFPAQAILRLRPDLQSQPVAVFDGQATQETVCSLNSHAKKRGIEPGMTRLEVEEYTGIHLLSRSLPTETAARSVLLECASRFSPRIEEFYISNACGFVLDIAGSDRLFGPPMRLAQNLSSALDSSGFRTSICVSSNFDAARIKAIASRGITVIPIGGNASELACIAISFLAVEQEYYDTLARWGIRTLGELAALPEEDVVIRLGQRSTVWLSMSSGTSPHTFQPVETKFELKEHIEFETYLEQLDSLLFIGAQMINNLVARASGKALAIASLTLRMSLDRSGGYERTIRPALPSCDRKFLLKLLQLEIASHPPQAAIRSLTLVAEAGLQSKMQLGLFTPQAPEPSRLDVTIARLKALIGDGRIGSPALMNTHRGGSFRMDDFSLSNGSIQVDSLARMSLRRMRPPNPLQIKLQSFKPTSFDDGSDHYQVLEAYGPWQSSGSWWSVDQWDMEEWDVMAVNYSSQPFACLIVHDRLRDRWILDAVYD